MHFIPSCSLPPTSVAWESRHRVMMASSSAGEDGSGKCRLSSGLMAMGAPDTCTWTAFPSPCDSYQELLGVLFLPCDALSDHSGSRSIPIPARGHLRPADTHHRPAARGSGA